MDEHTIMIRIELGESLSLCFLREARIVQRLIECFPFLMNRATQTLITLSEDLVQNNAPRKKNAHM